MTMTQGQQVLGWEPLPLVPAPSFFFLRYRTSSLTEERACFMPEKDKVLSRRPTSGLVIIVPSLLYAFVSWAAFTFDKGWTVRGGEIQAQLWPQGQVNFCEETALSTAFYSRPVGLAIRLKRRAIIRT